MAFPNTGLQVANTYLDLLTIHNSNAGISSTTQIVYGANGTATPLSLSSTVVQVNGFNLVLTGTSSLSGTNTGDQTNISGNAGTVTNGVYTTDIGTVTNTMLAGGIANNKLVNTAVASLSGTNTGDQTNVSGSSGSCTGNAATATTASAVTNGGALNTPATGTLTNCTGYTDANLSTSDVTTNNVSTSKHGFAPKLDNIVTHFLNGQGGYTTPAGASGTGICSFSAYVTSTSAAVTGDGTVYTIASFTKIADTGTNFNASTGIFTAPQAGWYLFTATIVLESVSALNTNTQLTLVASSNQYDYFLSSGIVRNSSNQTSLLVSQIIKMATNDTASIFIYDNGNGSKNIKITGAGTNGTFFSGVLLA